MASFVEILPIALTMIRRDADSAGGWKLLAVNERCREYLSWTAFGGQTIYDWLRALGEKRNFRDWFDDPTSTAIQTSRNRYQLVRLGDDRIGISLEPNEDKTDWQQVLVAALKSLHVTDKYSMAICRNDGRLAWLQLSSEGDKSLDDLTYIDQVLPAAWTETAYDALDSLISEGGTRSSDLVAAKLADDLNLLAFEQPSESPISDEEPIPSQIFKQIEGVIVAVGQDGRIIASSLDADRFWDGTLTGQHIDDFLEPERNGSVTFWASVASKSAEVTLRSKIWAQFESGHKTRVRLHRRDITTNEGDIVLLRIDTTHEARGAEQTIHNLAHFDQLTGLPNRQLFSDRLANAIEHAKRYHQVLTIMVVDVDRFKLINDSLGLDMGDIAIKSITERIVAAVDDGDTIARSGADEFLLMCFRQSCAEDAARLAKSIHAAFRAPVTIGPHEISVSVSIGIALFPYDGDEPANLLRNADAALGRAKAQGRNISQFFTDDMNATAFERLMLENRLRKALQNNELRVYYQPQVRVGSGHIVGVEALIRWFHPELGVISPAEFIPLAEETGLIIPIGLWALEEACRQVRVWHKAGHDKLRLAVNLSALQFEQENLISQIKRVLADTGLPVSCLELELTESVVMRNAEETVHRLLELRKLGVSLAVDDFGTGYSSLAYLKRFPLRSLKIDRSFVGDIDRDANSLAIVQAIIALGNSLGIKLVAEGVETSEQLEKLRLQGCEEMQGYLFSRPLPDDELGKLLANHGKLKLAT